MGNRDESKAGQKTRDIMIFGTRYSGPGTRYLFIW